jgi:hypothetical protein
MRALAPEVLFFCLAKAGCPIQARFWLEWDTTALTAPFFLIRNNRLACGKLRKK